MMAAASVLDLHGGKVMMFVGTGSSCGPGHSVKSRNEKSLIGTDKEKELYQPQDNFWRRLGAACVKRFVSVDIFAVSNASMDMASLSHVSKVTAGQVYYNSLEGQHYRNTVMMNLNRNMQRNQGWEAVMRIRVSKGLEISNYYGNFNMWTDHDMDIVSVDCDKAVAVQFKYVDDLLKHPVCIQAAMLYTNRLGERRIRVLTQQLTITSQLANVFRGADVDAIMNFSLRGCLQACITSTIQAARDSVLKRTINSLHAYRRSCAQSSSLAQLILPESLKLLTLY
jgi:protein transport protein SEC24